MNPHEPRAEIFYRLSDRLGWTLLGTISYTKVKENVNVRVNPDDPAQDPLHEQRYQFVKHDPVGDAAAVNLPEFNEIQFKLKTYNGFSIIGAWIEYSYITRNTLK